MNQVVQRTKCDLGGQIMTVTINQLIDKVREELLESVQANTAEAMYPFLFVEEVEVEIGVKVSSGVEGSGKVSIEVIEVGAGVSVQDEATHRIKVKLTPFYSKEETRKRLEQQLGPRGTEQAKKTSIKGTAKDLFSDGA